jgi:hypothetical protein
MKKQCKPWLAFAASAFRAKLVEKYIRINDMDYNAKNQPARAAFPR